MKREDHEGWVDSLVDEWLEGLGEKEMSTTKIVYLQGPVKFAKVFEFNRDKGKFAPKDGQYCIDVGLGKDDFKEVQTWNPLYKGKVWPKLDKFYLPGDSKLTYVTFKRKHKHFKADGEEIITEWSGPPTIVDVDGDGWNEMNGGGGLIGNGSICTVKLDVTTVDGRTFVRLEGIRVDEHVEYESDGEEREPATEENRTDGLPF